MDVGVTNGWNRRHVVTASEILERIDAVFPIEPVGGPHGVAERYRYLDGSGELGVIASVTRPFCGDCTRARLSADGHFFTCLFAAKGTDLRSVLRGDQPDAAVLGVLRDVWEARRDRYSEERASAPERLKVEMSYIGG
jgi:cyclic pyranopterin phosphate synthase